MYKHSTLNILNEDFFAKRISPDVQSNGLGEWTVGNLETKASLNNPKGMGESLERLHKECCLLQEQLAILCESLAPIFKPLSKEECKSSNDVDPEWVDTMSERTALVHNITNKIWEMQRFVDTMYRSADL